MKKKFEKVDEKKKMYKVDIKPNKYIGIEDSGEFIKESVNNYDKIEDTQEEYDEEDLEESSQYDDIDLNEEIQLLETENWNLVKSLNEARSELLSAKTLIHELKDDLFKLKEKKQEFFKTCN